MMHVQKNHTSISYIKTRFFFDDFEITMVFFFYLFRYARQIVRKNVMYMFCETIVLHGSVYV